MKNSSTMDVRDINREDLYSEIDRVYGHHPRAKKHPWKSKLGWWAACVVVILYVAYEFLHCVNAM